MNLDCTAPGRITGRKIVELLPTTKRYKQLIKAHGPQWIVVARERVACFGYDEGLLIESMCGDHSRWVLPDDVRE